MSDNLTEAGILRTLDVIAFQEGLIDKSLPQSLVDEFLTYHPGEGDKSVSNRAVIARQLAKYMLAHDMEAYVAPPFPKKQQQFSSFVPHIYSNDELKRLFTVRFRYACK